MARDKQIYLALKLVGPSGSFWETDRTVAKNKPAFDARAPATDGQAVRTCQYVKGGHVYESPNQHGRKSPPLLRNDLSSTSLSLKTGLGLDLETLVRVWSPIHSSEDSHDLGSLTLVKRNYPALIWSEYLQPESRRVYLVRDFKSSMHFDRDHRRSPACALNVATWGVKPLSLYRNSNYRARALLVLVCGGRAASYSACAAAGGLGPGPGPGGGPGPAPGDGVFVSAPDPDPATSLPQGRGQLENEAIVMISLSLIDLKSASMRV